MYSAFIFQLIIGILYTSDCSDGRFSSAQDNSVSKSRQQKLIQLCPQLCKTSNGCTSNIHLYRYDNTTQNCYLATGGSGPCGNNMIFYGFETNDVYGYCDCDSSARQLIYHRETDQCYFIYQQAICPTGYWLGLHSITFQPQCKINPCANSKFTGIGRARLRRRQKEDNNDQKVNFHNRCVKLNSWQPECKENQVIQFEEDNLDPICTQVFKIHSPYAVGVLTQSRKKCKLGTFRSITGKCKIGWTWN